MSTRLERLAAQVPMPPQELRTHLHREIASARGNARPYPGGDPGPKHYRWVEALPVRVYVEAMAGIAALRRGVGRS